MVRHTELNKRFALRLRGIFLVRNCPKNENGSLVAKCSHFATNFCKLRGIFQSSGQYLQNVALQPPPTAPNK